MFIVITGLDGSGTSTIAQKLAHLDHHSIVLKTPSSEYADRNNIDLSVKQESITAHFLYYLSSTVYMSDYIKHHLDYKNHNVYCVRYLIDTVVSNRVAGVDVDLDYNIFGNELLKPDLTLFISAKETLRQQRISARGKSVLDKLLDDEMTRNKFLNEFKKLLPTETIYVDNSSENIDDVVANIYKEICAVQDNREKTSQVTLKKTK